MSGSKDKKNEKKPQHNLPLKKSQNISQSQNPSLNPNPQLSYQINLNNFNLEKFY